jgi:hypothetical protein
LERLEQTMQEIALRWIKQESRVPDAVRREVPLR